MIQHIKERIFDCDINFISDFWLLNMASRQTQKINSIPGTAHVTFTLTTVWIFCITISCPIPSGFTQNSFGITPTGLLSQCLADYGICTGNSIQQSKAWFDDITPVTSCQFMITKMHIADMERGSQ